MYIYFMSNKQINSQDQWGLVPTELVSETIKLASYDNLLLELIGDATKKKVLDYGCGPGILLAALQAKKAEVYGFDISPEMIAQAQKYIAPTSLYTNFNQVNNMQFDVVICNLVLCIINEQEVERVLKNIAQVLKKRCLCLHWFL